MARLTDEERAILQRAQQIRLERGGASLEELLLAESESISRDVEAWMEDANRTIVVDQATSPHMRQMAAERSEGVITGGMESAQTEPYIPKAPEAPPLPDTQALPDTSRLGPALKIFRTEEAKRLGVPIPTQAYTGDAGFDLRLCAEESLVIPPHQRAMVPTGLGFEIPDGWYGLVCNRTSGGKRGLIPIAQVVDSNFTGSLPLCLQNTNHNIPIEIQPLERCAQIVFMPHWRLPLVEIEQEDIKVTERGSGKFGSSGKM